MNRPRFRRHPRPTETEWKRRRADHLHELLPCPICSPEPTPTPTRYDAEWPDVRAAEVGGDLAAMAAPLIGDWGEYEVGPWPGSGPGGTYVYVLPEASSPEPIAPVKPRGRHRQTDPHDLFLAALRDLGGRP